jgi:hypothetical protein
MQFLYSVYDKKAQSYNTPFFCVNHDLAKRSFVDLCRDARTVISRNPEDFDLWCLGAFYEGTGSIFQNEDESTNRVQIMTGVEARISALKAERFASELAKASSSNKVEKNV